MNEWWYAVLPAVLGEWLMIEMEQVSEMAHSFFDDSGGHSASQSKKKKKKEKKKGPGPRN